MNYRELLKDQGPGSELLLRAEDVEEGLRKTLSRITLWLPTRAEYGLK